MKKCPFCAEEIQDEATKCRFCGEYLKKKKKWKGCLIGCLIASLALILLTIALVGFSFFMLKLILRKIYFGVFSVPPYHYSPFTGGGIEGILREFSEIFRALWERLTQGQRITF